MNITYKMFIENSASMNGYFDETRGARDLRLALFQLCKKIGCTDLSFINSREIQSNAPSDQVLSALSLSQFKSIGKQGNPAASDISKILNDVVSGTSAQGEVSLLVSDFIFCPPREKALTSLGPEAEKSSITKIFEDKGLAVAIFQLDAQFEGQFFTGHYESHNNRVQEVNYPISQKRPFYIWAIGGIKEIGQLAKRTDLAECGIKNTLVLAPGGFDNKTTCQLLPRKGNYEIDRQSNTHAINASIGKNGSFKIDIQANQLASLPLPDEYLSATENYGTSDSHYTVDTIRKNGDKYIITLSAPRVKAGTISVFLRINTPEWVERHNMESEWDIRTGDNAEKTFGLKALVDGAKDAMTKRTDKYTTLTIKIN